MLTIIDKTDSILFTLTYPNSSMSQSNMLSAMASRIGGGACLTRDSQESEGGLMTAVKKTMEHITKILSDCDVESLKSAVVVYKSTVSLFECQSRVHNLFPSEYPMPKEEAKSRNMRPDGGIIYVRVGDKLHPILVTEDKIQGTNDTRHEKGFTRQATGNAIERAAKNIRGFEMIFMDPTIKHFPYIIFAAGCDFHSSESIAARLQMMNYGLPNIAFEISNSDAMTIDKLNKTIDGLNCKKKLGGKCVASVFIKTHKWDEMPHGSSNWTTKERQRVCEWAAEQTVKELIEFYS